MRSARGSMNKTEQAYEAYLQKRILSGEDLQYFFESIGFRLGERCFYYPDFVVFPSCGIIEIHEVKGHWEDDARVKWQVMQDKYPFFKYFEVTRNNGLFTIKEVSV